MPSRKPPRPDATESFSSQHRTTHAETASAEEQAALFDISPPARATANTRGGALKSQHADQNVGHRQRLRDRFRTGGANAVPDYELLEMVLFRVFPRGDTKPIAKLLIDKFGSFAEVVSAPRERLMEVAGVGERAVDELRLIKAAAERLTRGELRAKPLLSSWSGVLDYLRLAQGFDIREQFRVLFLDKKNFLIADEVQGSGTVDHTPVYVREVVKRALELSSSAIILVHNHPSGDPQPSRADIDMTKLIVDAARPLGITVHDHVIVGRNGHASMKALQLI